MQRSMARAAKRLCAATDDELAIIVKHDPDMVRDVAKECVALMAVEDATSLEGEVP